MSDSQSMITRVTLTFEWSDGSVETADFKDPKKALFNQEVPLTELHVEPGRTIARPETSTINVEIEPGRDGWTLQLGDPSSGPSLDRWQAAQEAFDAAYRNLPDFAYPEARRALAELERLLAAHAKTGHPSA